MTKTTSHNPQVALSITMPLLRCHMANTNHTQFPFDLTNYYAPFTVANDLDSDGCINLPTIYMISSACACLGISLNMDIIFNLSSEIE